MTLDGGDEGLKVLKELCALGMSDGAGLGPLERGDPSENIDEAASRRREEAAGG